MHKKEILKYGMNGVLTTLINYLVFYILYKLHISYLIANTLAWCVAVIIAYFTNRLWVFKSNKKVMKEFLSFTSLRLVTLLVENVLLFVCISLMSFPTPLSKCIISMITILGNYIICHKVIFLKEEKRYG